MDTHPYFAAFVVRIARGDLGVFTGVVERVRTGEKRRFLDIATVGQVIAEMLGEAAPPPPAEPTPETPGGHA